MNNLLLKALLHFLFYLITLLFFCVCVFVTSSSIIIFWRWLHGLCGMRKPCKAALSLSSCTPCALCYDCRNSSLSLFAEKMLPSNMKSPAVVRDAELLASTAGFLFCCVWCWSNASNCCCCFLALPSLLYSTSDSSSTCYLLRQVMLLASTAFWWDDHAHSMENSLERAARQFCCYRVSCSLCARLLCRSPAGIVALLCCSATPR